LKPSASSTRRVRRSRRRLGGSRARQPTGSSPGRPHPVELGPSRQLSVCPSVSISSDHRRFACVRSRKASSIIASPSSSQPHSVCSAAEAVLIRFAHHLAPELCQLLGHPGDNRPRRPLVPGKFADLVAEAPRGEHSVRRRHGSAGPGRRRSTGPHDAPSSGPTRGTALPRIHSPGHVTSNEMACRTQNLETTNRAWHRYVA